ncbi:MAG: translation initiation factor IF-2 [bacterium]
MNVSELARKLNMPVQDLREILPKVGFDIGFKAIKVDDAAANRIIKNWPRLYREYQNEQHRIKEEKERQIKANLPENKDLKPLQIPSFITVKDFALKIETPLVRVMSELMKNGVLATLNEKIDYETASIIADEFGYKTEFIEGENLEEQKNEVNDILAKEEKEALKFRPPVVVVMGHVDHGKTKLLDTIRKTNVIAKEAGGITQHIGAYQVTKSISNADGKVEDRVITFIDTPGHEAFTAMRSRGAKIADIAILVVAADDGVKPQTKEAIKIIEQAHLPMIVAINKIDKEGANIDKVKSELAELNLTPEDWGGKTVCMPISAMNGMGINELLETIILTADLNEDKILANPSSRGLGTVIESNINKGEGPIATVIVQNGTINKNEYVNNMSGDILGKIRAMKNYLGEEIENALPSTPVRIIGLKMSPKVGDILETNTEKLGRDLKKKSFGKMSSELDWHKKETSEQEDAEKNKINIILKTDVVGSLEAIIESLAKIESSEVRLNLIKKGLGNITDADILMAASSDALILAFNVAVMPDAQKLAVEKNMEVHKYKIIYELLGLIKDKIASLEKPKFEEHLSGKMKVLAIFRTERSSMILGGKVIEGEVVKEADVKVFRGDKLITDGKATDLESAKEKVTVCQKDQECGIKFEGAPLAEEGDVIEFWVRKEIK